MSGQKWDDTGEQHYMMLIYLHLLAANWVRKILAHNSCSRSTIRITLTINHEPWWLRGPAGTDVMAWAMYFMRHIYPASHVRLHCCVWNSFINPGDISSDLSCFRSPPPWASWASDQLLRPRPDQGHGHCGHQCGGHWLPDVPRAPVHTPGHPGGKVTWLYIYIFTSVSWHCSFDLHEITTGLLSVLNNPRIRSTSQKM